MWVSLSRTMEKTTTDRDAERTRKRGRKGDEAEEENSEKGRQRREVGDGGSVVGGILK